MPQAPKLISLKRAVIEIKQACDDSKDELFAYEWQSKSATSLRRNQQEL